MVMVPRVQQKHHIFETLNLTVYKKRFFKRIRKLFKKIRYHCFFKIEMSMPNVRTKKSIKKTKLTYFIEGKAFIIR